MGKCRARKRVFLLLGIFSAASAVIGAPLLAFSALKLEYVPLLILFVFVAHGIWGVGFYFIAYSRERVTLRVLDFLKVNPDATCAEIGEAVGLTECGAKFIVDRARKKGYIRSCEK